MFHLITKKKFLVGIRTYLLTLHSPVCSPQFVQERLLCHAIIGRQGGKELIMKIDVASDFISPLLEFSTKSVYFRVDKVRQLLATQYLSHVWSRNTKYLVRMKYHSKLYRMFFGYQI